MALPACVQWRIWGGGAGGAIAPPFFSAAIFFCTRGVRSFTVTGIQLYPGVALEVLHQIMQRRSYEQV